MLSFWPQRVIWIHLQKSYYARFVLAPEDVSPHFTRCHFSWESDLCGLHEQLPGPLVSHQMQSTGETDRGEEARVLFPASSLLEHCGWSCSLAELKS